MSSIKSLIYNLIFAISIIYYWVSALTLLTTESQYKIGIFSFLFVAFYVVFKKKIKQYSKDYSIYFTIILTTSIFIICFYSWNIIFNWYASTTSFKGNIFRGAFSGLLSPFYGHLYHKTDIPQFKNILMALSSITFLGYCIFLHFKQSYKKINVVFLLLSLLLLVAFSWQDTLIDTFLSNNCHYNSFRSDIHFFRNASDLLKNYNLKISSFGIHNNHYPPGILLLFKIEEELWPYFTKSFIFLSVIVGLIPFYKLMQLWKFSLTQKKLAAIVYMFSGAILFFPGVAVSPIMIPVSIAGFYFLIKGIYSHKLIYSILFGVTIAIYTFFTFTFFVYVLFCIITLFFQLKIKEIFTKNVIVFIAISVTIFALFYLLINFIFGFNIIECFTLSLSNENEQMANIGAHNWSRYFITSMANAIAYLGILGATVLGLIIYGFFNFKMPSSIKNLIYGLFTTVAIFSFSSHFFLEVERIWIFITPFFLLIAGWVLGEFYRKKQYSTVLAVLIIILGSSTILHGLINQCY